MAIISKERIQKADVLDSEDKLLITAENEQFSVPTVTNSMTGRSETLLIVKENDMPILEKNSEVSVIAYMRSGERIKYPAFVRSSTSSQIDVVLRTARAQVMEERRKYYKVQADLDCVINAIERGGVRNVLKVPAVAKIKDFSIGGIFLCICNEELLKNDKLLLTVDLNGNAVDVSAEIIRLQTTAEGDVLGYGCRFINVAPSTEENFAKYVFQVQLNNMRNDSSKQ